MSYRREAGASGEFWGSVLLAGAGRDQGDLMPPFVALIIWAALLVGLLIYDPAREPGTSICLWVPVIWMFIVASRLPSQWLGADIGQSASAQALVEGNPLDRSIDLIFILLAICILTSRSFKWSSFFSRNLALTAFLAFALISTGWSDFPFVAFKRWFRDLGGFFIILVALSDPRPDAAVRTVLRRLSYLLIPLSIVLDKYFPTISKSYDPWTGNVIVSGVTTGKNLLGVIGLIGGLFFFWDSVTRWHEWRRARTKRILLINVAFIVMSLSLLQNARSTTAWVCFGLGCLVIAAAHRRFLRRRPAILKTSIPVFFVLYLILAFGFGMNGSMAQAVGKDPTFTDRTKIWTLLLSMHTNPIVGAGYESFWLGPRLEWFRQNSGLGDINEAHNGYLEVYLQLGLVGLSLLILFLITCYRNICRKLVPFSSLASLGLAIWIVMLFYCMTEAGFRAGLMWSLFLLMGVSLPRRVVNRIEDASGSRRRHIWPDVSEHNHEVTVVRSNMACLGRVDGNCLTDEGT